MTDICAKAKDETENLYIANKKLWEQNRDTRIGRFLGPNDEKVNLPKGNPITGKHKHPKLRQKLVIGRMSILSSPKNCPNVVRVGHHGRGRLSLEKYNARRYKRRRQLYRRPSKY